MNLSRKIAVVALIALVPFASCKKNYVCTCTTAVGAGSVDVKHNIDNATPGGALKSCNNYQDEGNRSLPGSTSCRL